MDIKKRGVVIVKGGIPEEVRYLPNSEDVLGA